MESGYLDLAHATASRIACNAIWSGDSCTWNIAVPDQHHLDERRAKIVLAKGGLYQGTAGIGLFLAEAAAATNDRQLLRAAHGAARHAWREALSYPPHAIGFYDGRTGIAYFLARFARLTASDELARRAAEIANAVISNRDFGTRLDMLSGAAGAAPGLLTLARWMDLPGARDCVTAMADDLIGRAHMTERGWWWGPGSVPRIQGLTGLAHGASGYGYGLLEVYAETGQDEYRYAAEQAFLYERSTFQPDVRNWPDFRHLELHSHLGDPRRRIDLIRRLRAGGSLPAFELKCMAAWCHGAPGIALARLRAHELLGSQIFGAESLVALETTAAELEKGEWNASLCHGVFGNCDVLLEGARILREPRWRALAELHVEREMARMVRGGGRWSSGAVARAYDPSLMMGEAGPGLVLLRMHDDSIRSPLLTTSAPASDARVANRCSIDLPIRRQHVDRFLATSIRAIDALQPSARSVGASVSSVPTESDATAIYRAINHRIDTETDPRLQALMIDAFEPERRLYDASVALCDLSAELRDSLTQPQAGEVQWRDLRFVVAEHASVIRTTHDWGAWLGSSPSIAVHPCETEVWHVLFRYEHEMRLRSITPLSAALLAAAKEPASTRELANRVIERVDVSGVSDIEDVRDVLDQLIAQFYRVGLLAVDWDKAEDAGDEHVA